MPKSLSKSERINIRVTPLQKRIIEEEARKENKTLSEYLIKLGLEKAYENT